jgi:hypothetical protein
MNSDIGTPRDIMRLVEDPEVVDLGVKEFVWNCPW